jgi:hypothetical protein
LTPSMVFACSHPPGTHVRALGPGWAFSGAMAPENSIDRLKYGKSDA